MRINWQNLDGKRQGISYEVPRLPSPVARLPRQGGISLIELVVFIVVIAVGLSAMVAAINYHTINSVDPVVQLRALECAQAKLDEIITRRFDENSATGGVPACGSAETNALACQGVSADADFDDVGDFNGQIDTSKTACTVSVTVVNDGAALGLANDQARRITVEAISPTNGRAVLSTYRTNF